MENTGKSVVIKRAGDEQIMGKQQTRGNKVGGRVGSSGEKKSKWGGTRGGWKVQWSVVMGGDASVRTLYLEP